MEKVTMIRSIISGACFLTLAVGVAAAAPPNDDCADAQPISGFGTFSFDNTDATTDGPLSAVFRDVWYCWTGSCGCGELVTIDTCAGTTVDTSVAVYAGCDCPPSDPIAASDDDCGFQSSVTFQPPSDQGYLIRLGTHLRAPNGGVGTFTVSRGPAPAPPCQHPIEQCQPPDTWNALTSNATDFVVADDFRPTSDGFITEICWWGTYFDGSGNCLIPGFDTFEVRYYGDVGGVPGELIAGPFSPASGKLLVTGPERTYARLGGTDLEYEYGATHEPVSVTANQRYWIEIINLLPEDCTWYWEVASEGNGRSLQDGFRTEYPDGYDATDALPYDLAFCLDLPEGVTTTYPLGPANDDCIDAEAIFAGDELFFDTSGAITDGPAEHCFPLGDDQVHRDVWFDYEASCPGLLVVETCSSLFDTKLAIYEETACPPAGPPIICDDDGCGEDITQQAQAAVMVTQGQAYKIRVGGFDDPPEIYWGHDVWPISPPCYAALCAIDLSCCDEWWSEPCRDLADIYCRGSGGPGLITLELIAPPPADHDLTDFADFAACYTGACAEPPCDPPLFTAHPCCLSEDFDNDGDVDLDDFAAFHGEWEGP
jgi:hypothetical protein